MKHTYKITGMTCSGCVAKVHDLLSNVKGVSAVSVNLDQSEAVLTMENHISTNDLKASLKDFPKYQLNEKTVDASKSISPEEVGEKSWIETYRPVILIFAYITGVVTINEYVQPLFSITHWMNAFMAGFFLVFSFFKLLNIKGFAESYSMYDIVAKKFKFYGYIYVFIELGLGISYLVKFEPFITNSVTLIVMSISIIGVLQSVLNKTKIKCACLGDVFNLPMSTITIIEDGLMILMAGIMLITLT
ncbi:MAG: cation transporter [Bacteroidetes bacterium]|nr:cation transporter [Bacteroidota bacterium]